jgi:hypothetical protein
MTGLDRGVVEEAFGEIIERFHDHLWDEIEDHTGDCTHPECDSEECSRPSTAAEYFTDVRGWDESTLEEWKLGYAPPNKNIFLELWREGYDPDVLRATGLFDKNDRLLWRGRYVFPYLNRSGRPVYAIARCTGSKGGGKAGYDGHPADYLAGKYAKIAHTKDHVPLEEPIFGLSTLSQGDDVVIAEGIADAITTAEAGYSVLSPVTTQFKREHFCELLDIIETYDLGRVYVIPDSERAEFSLIDSDDVPPTPEQIYEAVNLPKTPPGIGGGLRTANYLVENGIEALVVDLPRSGLRKVDLDDYLGDWSTNLDSCMSAGTPPSQHRYYDRATGTDSTQNDVERDLSESSTSRGTPVESRSGTSSLWELGVDDVNSELEAGFRGKNPLGHTGDSENYFVVYEQSLGDGEQEVSIAKDYKRGRATYCGVTYLLVEEGCREIAAPEGSLSPAETWAAWSTARERGLLDSQDVIPSKALRHIAEEHEYYDFDARPDDVEELPVKAHNRALRWVNDEWWDGEGKATARQCKKNDASESKTWEDVRYYYNENKKVGRYAAVALLREKYELATPDDTEELLIYDPETGIFDQTKQNDLEQELEANLGRHYTQHETTEIFSRLRASSYVDRDAFDAGEKEGYYLCVDNGVLELPNPNEGEDEIVLHPHSPDYFFTSRIPHTYRENPDTSRMESFLRGRLC